MPSTSYREQTSGTFSSFGSNNNNNYGGGGDSFNVGGLFNSRTQFSAPIPSESYGLPSSNNEISRVPSITYGSSKDNGEIQGAYSSVSKSVSFPGSNSQITAVNSYGEPARDVNNRQSPAAADDTLFHMVQSQHNVQNPDTQTTASNTLQRRHKESSEENADGATMSDDKLKTKKPIVNDKLNAYLKYIAKSAQKPAATNTGFHAPTKTYSFNYEESPAQVNDSLASLSESTPINHKNNESNFEQNPRGNAPSFSDNQWKITENL